MNIIALGDTHRCDLWQEIAKKEDYDKFIFIGDYLDSRENISTRFQIENFERILDFKRNDPERVVVLIGNHGYIILTSSQITEKKFLLPLNDAFADRLMQICLLHEKFSCSYVGVTKTSHKNSRYR